MTMCVNSEGVNTEQHKYQTDIFKCRQHTTIVADLFRKIRHENKTQIGWNGSITFFHDVKVFRTWQND